MKNIVVDIFGKCIKSVEWIDGGILIRLDYGLDEVVRYIEKKSKNTLYLLVNSIDLGKFEKVVSNNIVIWYMKGVNFVVGDSKVEKFVIYYYVDENKIYFQVDLKGFITIVDRNLAKKVERIITKECDREVKELVEWLRRIGVDMAYFKKDIEYRESIEVILSKNERVYIGEEYWKISDRLKKGYSRCRIGISGYIDMKYNEVHLVIKYMRQSVYGVASYVYESELGSIKNREIKGFIDFLLKIVKNEEHK